MNEDRITRAEFELLLAFCNERIKFQKRYTHGLINAIAELMGEIDGSERSMAHLLFHLQRCTLKGLNRTLSEIDEQIFNGDMIKRPDIELLRALHALSAFVLNTYSHTYGHESGMIQDEEFLDNLSKSKSIQLYTGGFTSWNDLKSRCIKWIDLEAEQSIASLEAQYRDMTNQPLN